MALKEVDVWLNPSKSGKGFSVRIEGKYYVGAISTLKRVLNGEIKGMKLSLSEKTQENQETNQ